MKPVSFVTPTVHCFHGQMALIVCTDLFFFLDLVPHEAVGQVRKTATSLQSYMGASELNVKRIE